MTVEHVWVVDYQPVADAPVPVGSGASEPASHTPTSWDDDDNSVEVGENRNGLAIVITNGLQRIEVGRVGFKAELKRRSMFERKLRDIHETIAQPACDARNDAERRLARARAEAEAGIRLATDKHRQRVEEAREALRRVEQEPIRAWDGEARIEAEGRTGLSDED